MSILKSIFKPFVRGYAEAENDITEETADKKAFEAKLAASTGLDGILDAVTAEKKSRKDKKERNTLRDQILSL